MPTHSDPEHGKGDVSVDDEDVLDILPDPDAREESSRERRDDDDDDEVTEENIQVDLDEMPESEGPDA